MPNPSLRSFTAPGAASQTGSFNVARPTGTASGDVLLAVQYRAGASAPSTPTGGATWNTLSGGSSTDFYLAGWKKVAGGSEPANYSFDGGALQSNDVVIVAIQNASAVDASSFNSGTGATLTATGVTTANANELLVWIGSNSGSLVMGAPSGFTSELDDNVLAFAMMTQVAAGGSGNQSVTMGSSANWAAFLVAVAGAVAAGVTLRNVVVLPPPNLSLYQ